MPASPSTIRELLAAAARYLADKGVASPRLNAERLLGDVLALSRLDLYLQHDRPLDAAEKERFRGLLRRRAAGEPLQLLLGEVEFFGRPFQVAPGVFIPRPETEVLVEECLRLLDGGGRGSADAPALALEIGCGAGVIGVTLAAERPRLRVRAGDVGAAAVSLAERNAALLGVGGRYQASVGALWEAFPPEMAGTADLVVSNPPYVRRDELGALPVEVARHDPPAALDGGPEGLDCLRALAEGAGRWLRPGGGFAVEMGAEQAEAVRRLCALAGLTEIAVRRDYAGRDRVVTARRAAAAPAETAAEGEAWTAS